ncbi:MAG: 3-oxoacyl-[acyl-carrier-protein] reductase [Candidatus Portiera sp.]|nr:3-oxoacyl-[acyl-carrier-protein] reductase [Portiera sp.]
MTDSNPTTQLPNVLVTGASRGLGQAIALAMATKGHKVVGTATSAEGAAKITTELAAISPSSCGKVLRQNEKESVDQLFTELKEEEATPLILIANAGITSDNLVLRMKEEEWRQVLDVNLTGNFNLTSVAIKPMVKARWGRIIFIGSVVGSIGNLGQANYAASKAGLIGFSKSLAREFASRNITSNLIAPGFIDTDMTAKLDDAIKEEMLRNIPLRRYGKPTEVAALASFLSSEDSSYITGQTLHINGGMFMD